MNTGTIKFVCNSLDKAVKATAECAIPASSGKANTKNTCFAIDFLTSCLFTPILCKMT